MIHKFESIFQEKHGSVWGRYFLVPKNISKTFLQKDVKRVICKLNDSIKIHSGLMADGEEQYFITLNKEIAKTLKLYQGDKIQVELSVDDSKYGMEICPEFEELLEMDKEGSDLFHALTPGKQRNLIHIATLPKSQEIRIRKSLIILDYLRMKGGKLDFRELNQCLKDWRGRYE